MLAGIEAGGTTMTCVVAAGPGDIRRRIAIPSTDPATTLAAVVAFLRDRPAGDPAVAAIGVGSFGPLDLDPTSRSFGAILRTPKPGWSGFALRRTLAEALHCPVAIDTDVNASGLAEAALGAGAGLDSMAYITVGTGIGGGLIVRGRPLRGLTHPEMGHIRPRRHVDDLGFAGVCPFHADCLEGLASGTAIVARSGGLLSDLPAHHALHGIVADYLGQLCATLVLIGSPQRIVMGGGVMNANPALFDRLRRATQHWLGGYVQSEALAGGIERFIVPPRLSVESGVVGALMIAAQALADAGGADVRHELKG
jgi:fructokinase